MGFCPIGEEGPFVAGAGEASFAFTARGAGRAGGSDLTVSGAGPRSGAVDGVVERAPPAAGRLDEGANAGLDDRAAWDEPTNGFSFVPSRGRQRAFQTTTNPVTTPTATTAMAVRNVERRGTFRSDATSTGGETPAS